MELCRSIFLLLVTINAITHGWCNVFIDNECSNKYCIEQSLKLPNTMAYGNKTYFFNTNKQLNWHNADIACRQYNMQLATIESYEEFNIVKNFILETVGLNGNMHIWVGGTDLATEGKFYWINGKPFELPANWAPTQPDNAGKNEHCLEIGYHSYGIKFNDLPCKTTAVFICESQKTCGSLIQ